MLENINEANSTINFIKSNISLKDKNWFRTGGTSKFYCEPTTPLDFELALKFAKDNNLEIFVLGEGANILISDSGFDGLTIRPNLKKIEPISKEDSFSLIKAQAGVKFSELIDFCLNSNLGGLEEFSGIPGTVGGSVYINIHYFEFLLDQFLVEASVIEKSTGKILKVDKEWFKFGYDTSKLMEKEHFLIDATFKLKNITDIQAAYAKGRSFEMIRYRSRRYPTKNTCGSFFRNFHENEVDLVVNGKKMIFVAYYLDKLGIKGSLRCGDAQVSHQHANMIVNLGNATSQDIIDLVHKIEEMMLKEYGIKPYPECQLVGF